MPLSNSDAQAIIGELQRRGAKIGNAPCSECGGTHVNVYEEVQFMPQVDMQGAGVNNIDLNTGRSYLAVRCGDCTLTRFYDLGDLGYTGPGSLVTGATSGSGRP